jgi:hypothetical protein
MEVFEGQAKTRGWDYVTTTVMAHSVDDGAYSIPLPFEFKFLGTPYRKVMRLIVRPCSA